MTTDNKCIVFKGYVVLWFGIATTLLLLLLPNVMLFVFEGSSYLPGRASELLAVPLLLWLLLLVVVRRYFFWLALLFVWIAPLEALYIVSYGRPTDTHIFGILADTNLEEAFNYIKSYLPYWLVYCALSLWGAGRLFKLWRGNLFVFPRVLIVSVLCAGSVVVVGAVYASYSLANKEKIALDGVVNSPLLFQDEKTMVESAIENIYPIGLFVRFSNYQQQLQQMAQLKLVLSAFRFGAEASAYKEKEIYILVIGETARASNWSLNGYGRDTNPLLSQQKNVVSFSNMVSGWLWTRMSVPVILTRKPVANKNIFFPEKSIVSLFSEAGFSTWWLSMQSPYGFHDSPIALHSSEADYVRFLNPADYKGAGKYDDVLLPALQTVLASDKQKLFIVLHLMGSHFSYGHRYPDSFDFYKPSMKQKNVALQNKDERERLVNSYDNSLRFTDYILDQIISLVKGQNVVSGVFYVADHGEVIFDEGCDKSGHGHHTEWDHRNASALWLSDTYIEKNEDRYRMASSRKNSPLSTENVFYSLAGMAGINYEGIDLSRDIFSEAWVAHPRNLQNGMDYDATERSGVCRLITNKQE
jgi:glucan phosphoethanolaminetransferase (alkaline phosphatase superfamily)